MKTLLLCFILASCAPTPENTALTREAMFVALAEYQRQHPVKPVTPEK